MDTAEVGPPKVSDEMADDYVQQGAGGAGPWVMDSSDPEVAARGEFGDAIQGERRQTYTTQDYRSLPQYIPSRQTTEPERPHVMRVGSHRDVVPDKYGGKMPWSDYKRHFEACMQLNGWNDLEAGQYLATRLQGPALKVLNNLPSGDCISYIALVTQLERRFGPGQQAENFLMELRMRRRHKDESLQQLGQAIRDLTGLAYPEMSASARERLAKTHFSEAIDEAEIRAGIFRAHPVSLDDAIEAGLATESFLKAERARERIRPFLQFHAVESAPQPRPVPVDDETKREIEELKSTLKQLTAKLANMDPPSRSIVCYNCNRTGHMARTCPHPPKPTLGNDNRSSRWAGARPHYKQGPQQ